MDVVLPKSGVYVVAVSGGIDSMALLRMLNQERLRGGQPKLTLIVAHLDHGMREDAAADRELVQQTAKKYGLPFVYKEASLGFAASEATARQARYNFLRTVAQASRAEAIVTAHHKNDVLETAILNMLRGSGRKGLTALDSHENLLRPLLNVTKDELMAYARENALSWREDSTNADTHYARNYVRHYILPRFSEADKQRLWSYIQDTKQVNQSIDLQLSEMLQAQLKPNEIDRQWFNQLPHQVAREIMASWLRAHEVRDFTSQTVERLVVAAKTARPGVKVDVIQGVVMQVTRRMLALKGAER